MTQKSSAKIIGATLVLAVAMLSLPASAQIVPVKDVNCGFPGIACTGNETIGDIAGILTIFVYMALALIGVLAVIFLLYAGVRYISSTGNEEVAAQAKRQIIYVIIGIIVALGALPILTTVISRDTDVVKNFINPFINMATILIGTIAVIYFIFAGYRYITAQGDEEVATRAKRQIVYAIVGIIIAAGARIITSAFITDQGAQVADPFILRDFITPFINMAIFLIGTVAVIYFIYAGYRYITSEGDEQAAGEAKNQIVYGIVGIVIAAGSWVISGAFITDGVLRLGGGGVRGLVDELVVPMLNAVLLLAGVAATAYVILAGVLYFSAAGEEDQIARAKRQLIYAIVGIVVILLAATIVNFIRLAIT